MKYFVEVAVVIIVMAKQRSKITQKGYLTPINQLKVTAWASDGEQVRF